MRKTLLAGASCAALALGASQAFSADPAEVMVAPAPPPLPYINAVLSLWAGGAFLDSDDSTLDSSGFPTFGGDARIGGNQWILEIYGSYLGATDTGSDPNSEATSYFLGAGHFLWRDPGNRAIGIFAGLDAAGHMDSNDHSVNMFTGLEGAWFRDMKTYYGQFGGSFCVTGECSDTWETGLFGRAGVRHFFNSDAKLELDLLAAWGYFDSSDNSTWGFGWGAEYEQQVSGGPFSFFGAYRGTYTEQGCSSCSNNDVTDHTFLVGVRARTGATDLYTDYTDGSSVFNVPAHQFNRWRSFPDSLD